MPVGDTSHQNFLEMRKTKMNIEKNLLSHSLLLI